MTRTIDLETSSIVELKAAAFDLRRNIEVQDAQLRQLHTAIAERERADAPQTAPT